jgi:hypothetical protein
MVVVQRTTDFATARASTLSTRAGASAVCLLAVDGAEQAQAPRNRRPER